MDILATRVLSYPDESGNDAQLLLTLFAPLEAKEYQWKCGFVFGPPIPQKSEHGVGVGIDFIQAFVNSITYARSYLETWELGRRVHWQGMSDCGLLEPADGLLASDLDDRPSPRENTGSMTVLTTRTVGYKDPIGVEKEFLLTVFTPFKADDGAWKCTFTFDPSPRAAAIRHGSGADFIEALLDSLAKARATFEGTKPEGWEASDESFDCADLPFKVGRSFRTARCREPRPDMHEHGLLTNEPEGSG